MFCHGINQRFILVPLKPDKAGASMYDRRLDAIVAAAELGSFSKAAEKLSISTPALVK